MIRQAIESDFLDLKHIIDTVGMDVEKLSHPHYRLSVQKKGFLLRSQYTLQRHTADLKKIYLVAEVGERLVGFLRIDDEQEMEKSSNVFWYQPELQETYFSMPHADIGGLAVLPHVSQVGLASQLLAEAVADVKEQGRDYLFSFVALSPVTNVPSLLFHEKHGFERIAVSYPHQLFGMEGFQSILYGKKLT